MTRNTRLKVSAAKSRWHKSTRTCIDSRQNRGRHAAPVHSAGAIAAMAAPELVETTDEVAVVATDDFAVEASDEAVEASEAVEATDATEAKMKKNIEIDPESIGP